MDTFDRQTATTLAPTAILESMGGTEYLWLEASAQRGPIIGRPDVVSG